MFDPKKAVRLNVPLWEAVYKAEISPGVNSIIAIHDISRGRALGGCRMAQYNNSAEALTDILRLSRGMTFKNAIADLPLGGGKALIDCDPKVSGKERETILEEFGKFVTWVNSEQERYCTAEDMNTTVADMLVTKRYTNNINGITVDPSPYTAWGVYAGIAHASDYFAADLFDGKTGLHGKRVMVQGLGKVGMTLVDYLHEAGAKLYVTDIREAAIAATVEKYPDIVAVPVDELYDVEVDVFAPCAGGAVVTRETLNKIKFKILCGAANNQLQNLRIGMDLQNRGVVYCPDFIANMGGVCAIQYMEVEGLSHEVCLEKISETVGRRLAQTFETGFRENLPFNRAIDHLVKKILWGEKEKNLEYRNGDIFPTASAKYQ